MPGADADLRLGRQLLAAGRFDLAEPRLRGALSREPASAIGHALLAECLVGRGSLADATTEAHEAIRLAPDACYGHAALGAIASQQRRWRAAELSYAESIRLDPHDPNHRGALAYVLLNRGQARRAVETADAGLRLNPSHAGCLNVRALALLDLGRASEARESIRSALVSRPESAVLHSNLAFVLLGRGEARAARDESLEALRLDPTLAVAHANLRASEQAMRRRFTAVWLRTASWWRYRPVWQRVLFVAGLAVCGLISGPAWIMAVLIGIWWGLGTVQRAAAAPKSPLHGLAPLLPRFAVPVLLGAIFVLPYWPVFVGAVAGFAGFAASLALAGAAASNRQRRLALFTLALVCLAGGTLGQGLTPSGASAVTSSRSGSGSPASTFLSDAAVQACLLDAATTMDLQAAAAGFNLMDARGSILDADPPPTDGATNPSASDVLDWLARVTVVARANVEFMQACAAADSEQPTTP